MADLRLDRPGPGLRRRAARHDRRRRLGWSTSAGAGSLVVAAAAVAVVVVWCLVRLAQGAVRRPRSVRPVIKVAGLRASPRSPSGTPATRAGRSRCSSSRWWSTPSRSSRRSATSRHHHRPHHRRLRCEGRLGLSLEIAAPAQVDPRRCRRDIIVRHASLGTPLIAWTYRDGMFHTPTSRHDLGSGRTRRRRRRLSPIPRGSAHETIRAAAKTSDALRAPRRVSRGAGLPRRVEAVRRPQQL